MRLEKWWTPETIFATALGGVMAVVLGASLFARPHVSQKGSALIPTAVLEDVRSQQKDCNAHSDDEQEMIARSLRSRC
jgi:hypothetical protein